MRGHRRSDVPAAAAVVVGLLLAAGALLGLRHDRSTPVAFGSLSGRPGASRSVPARPAPERASTTGPSVRAARPTRMRIPTLGVTAPVEQVVTNAGLLDVPHDISHVGWWTGSALPGSARGATVIDGHVDSATDGEGALFHLADLRAGQRITLSTQAGSDVTYRVYARRVYTKTHALPTSLFTTTGPARLVLITCGGPFAIAARSYADNVVLFARPVGSR